MVSIIQRVYIYFYFNFRCCLMSFKVSPEKIFEKSYIIHKGCLYNYYSVIVSTINMNLKIAFVLFLNVCIVMPYIIYYISYMYLLSILLHARGTFPAGVCKYLLRNNWINRITSCHHLWTIPLVFWGCGGIFHWLSVPLSGIIIILNVVLSRWMTPISIENLEDEDDEEKYLYLNINLSHEMVSNSVEKCMYMYCNTISIQ
jgi:hypothetical protein